MRHGLWLLLVLVLSTTAATAGPRRALVVGNDDYPGRYRLRTCVNDANAVAEFLMAVGYTRDQIVLLHDASRQQMEREIQRLVDATAGERHDQVVFYFSGHGIQVEDEPGGDEADGVEEAFVAVGRFNRNNVEEILLRDDYFHSRLKQVAARSDDFVVVLDCCFSGGLFKSISEARRSGPLKTIPRAELFSLRREEGLSTKGLLAHDPQPLGAGAKSVLGADTPLRIDWSPGLGHLVFMTAASEIQPAQAGDPPREPLSKYTAAWLRRLEEDDAALRAGRQAKRRTLGELTDEIAEELHDIQTPTLLVKGISTDTPVLGGVFPLEETPADLKPAHGGEAPPLTPAQRDRVQQILEQLLTLPVDPAANGWRVSAEASCPGNRAAVGERYHLKVTPEHEGYLVVLAVQASGEVAFLFPNKYAQKNRVEAIPAGKHFVVPYADAFQAELPTGLERFYVYLLPTNPFAEFDFSAGPAVMAAGTLDDLLLRRPELKEKFDASDLAHALTRGMRVEAVMGACGAPPVRGGWARAVVDVRTVP